MTWISFGALPLQGKNILMTASVSMLLKSRASLTCFRACFLPGRTKDFSAPPVHIVAFYPSEISRFPNSAQAAYISSESLMKEHHIRYAIKGKFLQIWFVSRTAYIALLLHRAASVCTSIQKYHRETFKIPPWWGYKMLHTMPQLYDSVTMVTESSEMPQYIGYLTVQSQQVRRTWQT